MTESFKTYWMVDGVKVISYAAMKKMIESGKTGIEVSAESQFIAAEERKRQAKATAIQNEEISRVAAQRAHDQSPEGKQQAAIRFAQQNPGSVISGGMNPMAELDAFLPHNTSLLR